MAITVTPTITGQTIGTNFLFHYLYEPLEVRIAETGSTKIYIDLEIYGAPLPPAIQVATILETLEKYVEYDVESAYSVTIDLMKIVRQHAGPSSYKISTGEDFENLQHEAVFSKYKYGFKIYSDSSASPVYLKTTPIYGARTFSEFQRTPSVPENVAYVGKNDVSSGNHTGIVTLNLDYDDKEPSDLVPIEPYLGTPSLGGITRVQAQLTWKTRYGGWSNWGFELMKKSSSIKYGNNIEQGMFKSTDPINGGNPYVAANYSSVSETYQVTLKSLHVHKSDLEKMQDINMSPAIFIQYPDYETEDQNELVGNFELMRLSSASIPLDSMAEGGDVTITLSNISNTTIKTI